jgi:Concanavalin A-like lectin/glucanases superfamily
MGLPRRRLGRVSATIGVLATGLVAPSAVSAATVSQWHMDETSGRTMVDSLGRNPGTLQGGVMLGRPGVQGTSYGFPGVPAIVSVPSSASLNPGAASFSVTVHILTTAITRDDSADVIRKGLSTNSATLWKMELRPSSTRKTERVRCYFHGTSGVVSLYGPKNVADGAWHTITCAKSGSAVSVTQDGVTRTKGGTVGSISNSAILSIGAKSRTDDAYQGLVDEASFSR